MTELPGRKAIFTGAGAAEPPGPSPEEIAEIKNYEKTIAELKNQLEVMVGNNPVPMIRTTPTFTITDANAAYIQMSGISEKDLLKTILKNFRILSQSGEGAKVAIQSKRRSFGEVTVELPSGTRILEQYCIPVMDTDQEITSLLFVYNEITRLSMGVQQSQGSSRTRFPPIPQILPSDTMARNTRLMRQLPGTTVFDITSRHTYSCRQIRFWGDPPKRSPLPDFREGHDPDSRFQY